MDANPHPGRALVTGGTGLLGSHLCQRLAARGVRVRALVRPTSDIRFLRSLGVELIPGDLRDPSDCDRAIEGVEVVYHSAAKVGDWGTWIEFQQGCLEPTTNLAQVAVRSGGPRFVHISSTSAYGHPPEGGPPVEETAPLGVGMWPIWDGYTRSKVEQERILWAMARDHGLKLTVIRPSWLFGERDRTTTARVVDRLRRRGVTILGRGDNPLSAIYAGEVAEAAIRAGSVPHAVGEAYNITDLGPITQREYTELWARAVGVDPRPRGPHLPYNVAFAAALGLEAFGRAFHPSRPPVITRYAAWLLARDVRYSTDKAREQLGWQPSVGYAESIDWTVRWYLSLNRQGGGVVGVSGGSQAPG